MLAVVVLVAAAILVTALVVSSGRDDDPPAADDPRSSQSSDEQSEPTESATSSEDAERALAMTSFVETYLSTVVSDPAAAWDMLTPEFQKASGGFGQYKKFWDSVDGADVVDIGADPRRGRCSTA